MSWIPRCIQILLPAYFATGTSEQTVGVEIGKQERQKIEFGALKSTQMPFFCTFTPWFFCESPETSDEKVIFDKTTYDRFRLGMDD